MYKAIYQTERRILEHRPTHIQINPKLIVRRDYIIGYSVEMMVVRFYDGTSAVISEDCLQGVRDVIARREHG